MYEAFVNVSGDFDIAGRLRATARQESSIVSGRHAGTEVARRALAQAVIEAYYGLALANAQHRAAEGNLAAAEEFEHITSLLLSGGEVAAVDLTRAQLQTLTRRDELERARVNEEVAAGALRVFVGYEFSKTNQHNRPSTRDSHRFRISAVQSRRCFSQTRVHSIRATIAGRTGRTSRSLVPIVCHHFPIRSMAALTLIR